MGAPIESSGGREWLIVQNEQLVGAKGQESVSAPMIVAELDLENVRSEQFDDRSDLPTVQAPLRQGFRESHDVQ